MNMKYSSRVVVVVVVVVGYRGREKRKGIITVGLMTTIS